MKKIGYREIDSSKLVMNFKLSREFPPCFRKEEEKTVEDKQRMETRCNQLGLLETSIKEFGILQNPIVRPIEETDKFDVLCGNQRVMGTLGNIMCLVIECDDDEVLWLSFVENFARYNLNPFQEAYTFKKMKNAYEAQHPDSKQGGSHGSVGWVEFFSKKTGIESSYIYSRLKLLELPDKAYHSKLPASTLQLIAEVKDPKVKEDVLMYAVQNKLKGNEVEELIKAEERVGKSPFFLPPNQKFRPPESVMKEVSSCIGRLDELIRSDFSYFSFGDKINLQGWLQDHETVVRGILTKLEYALDREKLEKEQKPEDDKQKQQ
jgi:hypothetical protein